jgi:hypothetical protein
MVWWVVWWAMWWVVWWVVWAVRKPPYCEVVVYVVRWVAWWESTGMVLHNTHHCRHHCNRGCTPLQVCIALISRLYLVLYTICTNHCSYRCTRHPSYRVYVRWMKSSLSALCRLFVAELLLFAVYSLSSGFLLASVVVYCLSIGCWLTVLTRYKRAMRGLLVGCLSLLTIGGITLIKVFGWSNLTGVTTWARWRWIQDA